MGKYSSDTHRINANINTIFGKLSNPTLYKEAIENNLDRLPEEARKNLDKLQFNENSIVLQSPMGEVTLGVDNNKTVEPTRVVYAALNSPVKFSLEIELIAIDENTTEEMATINLDMPFFVEKMVSGQLKDGAKKFGELLKMLPY